jgi:hypothetical protein
VICVSYSRQQECEKSKEPYWLLVIEYDILFCLVGVDLCVEEDTAALIVLIDRSWMRLDGWFDSGFYLSGESSSGLCMLVVSSSVFWGAVGQA